MVAMKSNMLFFPHISSVLVVQVLIALIHGKRLSTINVPSSYAHTDRYHALFSLHCLELIMMQRERERILEI